MEREGWEGAAPGSAVDRKRDSNGGCVTEMDKNLIRMRVDEETIASRGVR